MIAGFAVLLALMISAGTVQAASILNSCTTYCHGTAIRDGVRKANPHFGSQSSAFPGNHSRHLPAAPTAASCDICHTPVANNNFGHQNNVINMSNSLKGYSSALLRAKYDKGVFFNQTSVPNLTNARCSNTSCHFEKQTPLWGSAAYVAPADCNGCHGAPPAGTTVAPAGGLAGSHARHNVYYAGSTNCQKCHPDHTTFTHATSAGRSLKVQGYLRTPLNALEVGATYSGSGNNYLPSKSGSQLFGSCSSLYCHSSGQNPTNGTGIGTTYKTAAWGSAALTCAGCHVDEATDATGTGSHKVHTIASGANYDCVKCHLGYTKTTVTTATHVNSLIELGAAGFTYSQGSGAAHPSANGYGTCSATVCHGTAATVTWGGTLWSTTDQCGKCHSSTAAGAVSQAVPFYSTSYPTKVTAGTDSKVGAHTNHMASQVLGISASTACADCHGAVTLNGVTHMNGSTTLVWSLLATKNGALTPVYTAATGQCSATYCHGNSMPGGDTSGSNKAPVWKDPNYLPATVSAAACGLCHGFPPPTSAGHPAVTIPAGFPATATIGTTCSCHSNVNTSGNSYATMFVNPALHVNGILETPAGGHAFPYSGSQHMAAAGTAPWSGCTGCHSNSVGGTYPVTAGTAPNCTACHIQGLKTPVGTSSCWDCHGASATNGLPNGTVFPNNNLSHSKHAAVYGSNACNLCHVGGGSGAATHGPSNRVAKTAANVLVAGADIASYTAATNTCNTVACHGGAGAQWGVTAPGCINCHAGAITRTKGRPGVVMASVVAEFGLAWSHKRSAGRTVVDADCIVCHLEGDATSQKTSARHADGNIDLRDPDGTGEQAITNVSTNGVFTFQRFSTSYAAGSRTTTGHLSDSIDNVVTQKFCLKCHDAGGAANSAARVPATGTAFKPFGTTIAGAGYVTPLSAGVAGGVVDVDSQLAVTNSSFHPVKGPNDNSYVTSTTTNSPYGVAKVGGTPSNGVVMNCFDCHNVVGVPLTRRTVSAHGNAVTLRGVATVSGTPSATNNVTFCKVCHATATYQTGTSRHGTGSAFTSSTDSGMTSYMSYGCNMCHSSGYTTAVIRPVRGQDAHGVNVLPTGGTAKATRWAGTSTGTPAAVNAKPYAFIRNTAQLSNHSPKSASGTTYTPSCNMAVSPCSQGSKNYTVGGTY